MNEEQLRLFFRQKIRSLTTGKDLLEALNAVVDFVLAEVAKGPKPTPDPEPDPTPDPTPTPQPVTTTAYKTASYATFSYA